MTRTTATILLALLLAGCGSPTPMLDERFGSAVLANKRAQYLHPDAGASAARPAGLDGTAARAAVQRYDKGFESPAPTIDVINIGGGITGGGQGTR